MKAITITMKFLVSDEDYKGEHFQTLMKDIKSKKFDKEMVRGNEFDVIDLQSDMLIQGTYSK